MREGKNDRDERDSELRVLVTWLTIRLKLDEGERESTRLSLGLES